MEHEAVGGGRRGVEEHCAAGMEGVGLKPHRVDTFKVSGAPKFEEKLVDVVGMYLDPRGPRGADDLSGGERPSPPAGPVVAGTVKLRGSPTREMPGRVGAALTTPGRVSIARWGGSGKRDEEEYARNRRDDVPRKVNRLKSGGYGPGAVSYRAGRDRTGGFPGGDHVGDGSGGHGDVLRGRIQQTFDATSPRSIVAHSLRAHRPSPHKGARIASTEFGPPHRGDLGRSRRPGGPQGFEQCSSRAVGSGMGCRTVRKSQYRSTGPLPPGLVTVVRG